VTAAAKLPEPAPLYAENVKLGIRGVTLQHLGLSASDPKRIYVSSRGGYVFGSGDGGLTWNEGRLIVKRRKFFGALRPSPISSGAPFSVSSNMGDLQAQGMLKYRFDGMMVFPYGTSGESYLELSPDSPAFWDPMQPHPLSDPGLLSESDSGGGEGGGGDASRLGIGLKTSAKWLARLLRKKKKKPLTMNLQLTLAVKGVEPTVIHCMAVHPTDPLNVLAASDMGLWQSTDGGYSWFLLFPGSTRKERIAHYVGFHPTDHDMILLATGQGVRISRNAGATFDVIKGTQLSTAKTHWIQVAPSDPNVIYAATTIGAFRSDDRGVTWKWVYFETLPTQNYVSAIVIDPHDPMKITLGTKDGLFQSDTGGSPWKRSGGFLFTGNAVSRLAIDPDDGRRIIAITWLKVWETRDRGATWTAVYINDSEWSPRDVRFDLNDKSTFWIVTSGEILRISSKAPDQPDPAKLAAFHARVDKDPTLPSTLDLTFRAFGVHRGSRAELRASAAVRGWLPQVDLVLGATGVRGEANLDHALYHAFVYPKVKNANGDFVTKDGTINVFGRDQTRWEPYGFLKLRWDFGNVVFDLEEAPFGRVFDDANRAYLRLRSEIQRAFEERRRVLERVMTRPPSDLRSRLFLKLRLVELTAELDAFTDGAWAEPLRWSENL
jgi:photosystem II stability/assembly factor-like uncharacterized protein